MKKKDKTNLLDYSSKSKNGTVIELTGNQLIIGIIILLWIGLAMAIVPLAIAEAVNSTEDEEVENNVKTSEQSQDYSATFNKQSEVDKITWLNKEEVVVSERSINTSEIIEVEADFNTNNGIILWNVNEQLKDEGEKAELKIEETGVNYIQVQKITPQGELKESTKVVWGIN